MGIFFMKVSLSIPRSIIVKSLVTTKDIKNTFEFFTNPKNWESGGILKNIRKSKIDLWLCDSPFGEAKIRLRSNERFGVLDYDFIVDSEEWTVFSRVMPNGKGSSVSWLFIRPELMTQERFESQLKNFDSEIIGLKKALEA